LDIPKVNFTRLFGFIDILNHMGGKSDVAAISSKEELELDDILPILEAGKMLGLIEVKSGDVSITEKGYSLLAATPSQQKIILKDAIMKLRPFQKLIDLIKQSKSGYITKQDLLQYPSAASNADDDYYYDFANNFDWIIGWGRVALLIDYSANNESIRLRSDVEHNE
jgi:NitT/TauT family transport system ATP-binding protein